MHFLFLGNFLEIKWRLLGNSVAGAGGVGGESPGTVLTDSLRAMSQSEPSLVTH